MSDITVAVFEDARCAALQAPLSADAPLGVDVRDDSAFETLETEVRLIDTQGPSGVRWDKVAAGGLDLLTHCGRDLLVVAWTIYGLGQQERWRGLAVGFSCLAPMVTDHWDTILPKRERARVGALEWLTVRLTPVVTAMEPEAGEAAAVLHVSAILEDLHRLLPEKLVKEQAAIGDLVRAVRVQAEKARESLARAAAADAAAIANAAAAEAAASAPPPSPPAPLPAPPPAAPPAPAPAAAAAHVPAPDAPPVAPAGAAGPDMERALSALAASMRQHAASLRDADLTDPRSYRLTRVAAWLDITAPPEAKGATTQLFPPGAQRRQSIEALHRAGEHEAVVRDLEALIGSAPFWLDANRLVCDALAMLGPRYGLAVGAVLEATAGFARRLPELAELTFSDGMPFADAATRDWLSQQAGGSTLVTADAPSEDLADLQSDVRELAANGKKAEALDRLAAARERARDGRQVFDIQALQAQLCLDMDMPGVALPLVVHLQSVADARALEQWEPALALKAAGLAMRAFRHPSAAKVLGEERLRAALEAAQQQLAHLDLRAASRFVHP